MGLLIALCAAVGRPPGVEAQTVDAERFRKFLASDFHKALIAQAGSGIPKEIFHSCPTLVAPETLADLSAIEATQSLSALE